jgi:hypothetical protein
LKSIFLESDNSLCSSSIELKFWIDVEGIYLMCLPKVQGVWNNWERVISHFVFRSQFEVISRKWQDLSNYEVKWAENLKDGSRHNYSCFTKTFNEMGAEKWFGCFWFLNHSLRWFLVVLPKDEFALHMEWTWVCLDIIDETHEPFPWHLICFWLVPTCIYSHCTHANELDIGVDD